jgi:hydrogenase nickel incorporation protein HypA/HybF
MHEEAVLQDLVRKVEEVARANGAARVTRVRLWVGALSHLSESGLGERWALATRATTLEGSEVEVEMSTDARDPKAAGVILRSVDVSSVGAP